MEAKSNAAWDDPMFVQAATSAKALAACVVALQSHLILPSTAHLGSAHEGWGMSDVDDFCSVRKRVRDARLAGVRGCCIFEGVTQLLHTAPSHHARVCVYHDGG